MRTVALVLLVTCAVCVFAQHDHLEPPEYASPEDVKRAMGTSYHVVAEGEGSVYNPCYADPTSDECETYKLSPKPEPKRDTDFAEKLSTNVKQASSDAKDYSLIISNFEGKVNDWCCAVTGKPLYTVSGDRDVLNYMYYFLSQVFDYNGQNYAGRLVLAFHNNREADLGFNCDSVALGNGLMYSAPTDAFLGFREMFTAWLRKNEVNPKPVVNGFFPQARKLFSKFLRSRMLFANTTESTSEAAIAAVIPIVEKTDHLDYCEAGGEFSSIVQGETSIKFKATLDEMLRSCIDNGKLAKNPAEFGEVLLNSKREKEARELFATAVERGVLCNPWQRPDGLHRKDLPAVGIWPNYKLKGVVKAFKKLQPVVAAAAAKGALDVIGTRGDLTRTPLFSRQGVNQTLCAIANDDGCAEILRAAHTIMSSNDGYELACNGSLTIEIWRIAKSHVTQREVGATNLVVQAVAPLNGVPLTLQVGEDSTQLDGQATEPVVFDDSFEHVLSVGSEGDGYFLHAQVCHPSMHDKMLDIPTNECAEFEDDDE